MEDEWDFRADTWTIQLPWQESLCVETSFFKPVFFVVVVFDGKGQKSASAGLERVHVSISRSHMFVCLWGHSRCEMNQRDWVAVVGEEGVCLLTALHIFPAKLPHEAGRPTPVHLSSPLAAIGNLLSQIGPASKMGADGGEASQWRQTSLHPLLPYTWSHGFCPFPQLNCTYCNSEFQYLPGNVQWLANTTRGNWCNSNGRLLIWSVGSSFGRSRSSGGNWLLKVV